MFLLIPGLEWSERVFKSYLHSNMFLLIPEECLLARSRRYYLHSNMFLLIQKLLKKAGFTYFDLHSNMFLLIPAPLNHRLILPYYTIFCRPWYFLSFYLFRYNTVHRKHYFAYVFHVCRPLVVLSLSQVDNHKMKLVRSSFLPQNSLSIHFS